VPYALKIGPFDIAEQGLLNLYIAIEDGESIASVQAADDAEGLEDLVGQMPDAAWFCEPELAAAAVRLGIESAPRPPDVIEARATIAVGFALGAIVGNNSGPPVLWAFAKSAAVLWHSTIWELPESERLLEVELSGAVRGIFEVAIGGDVRTFSLSRGRGSTERTMRMMVDGRTVEAYRKVQYVVAFEERPPLGQAAEALGEALDMPHCPLPVRLHRGERRPVRDQDLVALAAVAAAIADVGPGTPEASVWVEVGALRVRAVARRATTA
jgi:hypothetical protein